jgi:hypothetical protein
LGILRRRAARDGQTLVEFALILPLFILLLTAVVEFSLALNAVLAINFASRDASLVAAEAGNESDADCLILATVEERIAAPADHALVTQVRIYRSDKAGNPQQSSLYTRGGSTTCTEPGGATMSVPYTRVNGAMSYPPPSRCNILAGCADLGRTQIDQIGVEITYSYRSHTPIGNLLGSSGQLTLIKGNVMRMEPVL